MSEAYSRLDMTLIERLHALYNREAIDELREAADALDAKDARIKELSRIVYLFVEAEDDYRAKSINASQYNDRIRDWTDRAREALNALEP